MAKRRPRKAYVQLETLPNACLLGKIGFDTAENELAKKLQHFAKLLILLIPYKVFLGSLRRFRAAAGGFLGPGGAVRRHGPGRERDGPVPAEPAEHAVRASEPVRFLKLGSTEGVKKRVSKRRRHIVGQKNQNLQIV